VPEVPSYGSQLVEMLLVLVGVCLIAWVALRLLGRRRDALALGGGQGPLRVVARLSLEPRRTLYVIDAVGRYFLVGASDQGMATLAELDREAVERTFAQAPPGPSLWSSLIGGARR
jgi:flagellar biogenesis protein FliO